MKRFFFGLFSFYRASSKEAGDVHSRQNVFAKNDVTHKELRTQLSQIEQKTGVLLTHISLMIAITAVLYSKTSEALCFQSVFIIELILYLCLAVLAIRCQFQFDQKLYAQRFQIVSDEVDRTEAVLTAEKDTIQAALSGELLFRERLFRFSILALYFLTFALIIVLIVKFLVTVS